MDLKDHTSLSAEEQIVHLKRLLVTVKQHYEKSLHQAQIQLQAEQNQRITIQKELDNVQSQFVEHQAIHEQEILSLKEQQKRLKELLKGSDPQKTRELSFQDTFQEQISEFENRKKMLENSLLEKEKEWIKSLQLSQEQQTRIEYLTGLVKEKEMIQDKYEQLKEEWKQLSEATEETLERQRQAEHHAAQIGEIAAQQEIQLQELLQRSQELSLEKEVLETERNQLKNLLDESEARLKVAQQHLAKKVKEGAILTERLEAQHASLGECAQVIEGQKGQIAQLQASVELYQRQEQRIQDQLHEALKGTESQIVKWEEKYFQMYDKWQMSEAQIKELKRVEEKHLQMQNFLANLGSFMETPFNTSHTLPKVEQKGQGYHPPVNSFSLEVSKEAFHLEESVAKTDSSPEKYDLFGMRQP